MQATASLAIAWQCITPSTHLTIQNFTTVLDQKQHRQ